MFSALAVARLSVLSFPDCVDFRLGAESAGFAREDEAGRDARDLTRFPGSSVSDLRSVL